MGICGIRGIMLVGPNLYEQGFNLRLFPIWIWSIEDNVNFKMKIKHVTIDKTISFILGIR